jgi:hypothetical protein
MLYGFMEGSSSRGGRGEQEKSCPQDNTRLVV